MGKIKKVINTPETIVSDVLEGIVATSDGVVTRLGDFNILLRTDQPEDKVGLVIGGGAGHEPMYSALVGPGLADASVCGEIYAAPGPDQIVEAAKRIHRGKGVLFVYGNYGGDIMTFDVATEMLADEGIEARTVLVTDDIAVEDVTARRGIAGAVYQVKVAGYACETAPDLDSAVALVEKVRANLCTIGVAVRAGSLPNTGEPTFTLGEDEMEIGMGMHGERGVERGKLKPADAIVDDMMQRLLVDLPFAKGDRVAVLLNNLGAMTYGELMIVYRRVARVAEDAGLTIARHDIGPIFTAQETAGFSISLLRLDEEMERALNWPAQSPGFVQSKGIK